MTCLIKKMFTIGRFVKLFLFGIVFGSFCFAQDNHFLSIETGYEKCEEERLELPEPQSDGRIQTLNEKGASSPVLDDATLSFLSYAKGKTVLEVGCGYGDVLLSAASPNEYGLYVLNDLDLRHLYLAAKRLKEKFGTESTKNVKLWQADITKTNSSTMFDAILVARVLHFFSPEDLSKTISNLYSMLNPGGQIFVIAITPYVKRFEKFIPEYELRKEKHDPFPGYVESLSPYLNEEVTSQSQKLTVSKNPFMFLDPETLSREFSSHGFIVKRCEFADLGYPSQSWCLNGRENVILVAQKPS
ncbi:MAG: hypothetical protein HEEMFOPI_00304 [Holosporales bacterium]